jgi:cytochrome c oxidase cbb3-type subunit II
MAQMLDIRHAKANLLRQAAQGDYDGDPARLTEMDALVAYLQVLGNQVDFKKYGQGYFVRFR